MYIPNNYIYVSNYYGTAIRLVTKVQDSKAGCTQSNTDKLWKNKIITSVTLPYVLLADDMN